MYADHKLNPQIQTGLVKRSATNGVHVTVCRVLGNGMGISFESDFYKGQVSAYRGAVKKHVQLGIKSWRDAEVARAA